MKKVIFNFLFVAISLISSCSLFVNHQPWAAGFFLENPDISGNTSSGYSEDGYYYRLSWNKTDNAHGYIITITPGSGTPYEITVNGYQDYIDISLDELWNKGMRFTTSNNLTYSIRSYNNQGNSTDSLTGTYQPLGDGTQLSPYRLFNESSFIDLPNVVDSYCIIVKDFSINSLSSTSSMNLLANLNGLNHTITYNFGSISSTVSYSGLFNNIGNGTNSVSVSNLIIDANVYADSGTYIGLLASNITDNSSINNISLKGILKSNNTQYIGSISGSCEGSISNSSSSLTIYGDSDVGGLVGQILNGCTITNSSTSCTIYGYTESIGGLVGSVQNNGNSINSCSSSSNISADSAYYVGGLVGQIFSGSEITIQESYTNVSISGHSYIGGFIGIANYGNISDCYSSGLVTGTDGASQRIGGFCGHNGGAAIDECYSSASVIGNIRVGGFIGWNSDVAASISSCFSTGSISVLSDFATTNIGGFIGYLNSGQIVNCYSTGSININVPTQNIQYIGGFIGGVSINNSADKLNNNYTSSSINIEEGTGTISFLGGFVGTQSSTAGEFINNIMFSNSLSFPSTATAYGPFYGTNGFFFSGKNCHINSNYSASYITQLSITDFTNSSSEPYTSWTNFNENWTMTSEGPILNDMPGNPAQDPLPWY